MGAGEVDIEEQSLAPLEAALGHKFRDPEILAWSLIHRSYHAEHPGVAHNERFEFLGDAVLGLAVTTFLFNEFGHMPEGQMAKVRAAVVSREELAKRTGAGLERSVDVQVTRLRRKTETDPRAPIYLQTVRGIGYKLAAD